MYRQINRLTDMVIYISHNFVHMWHDMTKLNLPIFITGCKKSNGAVDISVAMATTSVSDNKF